MIDTRYEPRAASNYALDFDRQFYQDTTYNNILG